ncbi:unnamed protein product [Paramecium octaurelia]|uniref:Uncharacterized protein n=1 Tax=Paramecium octaurelia TaxID=43137 RepID=A0A8S1SMM9_PAROT|nr:unnamed protein product [Paramecium octaurelia]
MIDSETFFAKYLISPRIQRTESDQRLSSLNAVQARFSPDRKIKSSFLQDEILLAPKNSQLLSQTIRSLLKNSWDLVEAIKEKNLIDPHLQYHLRKFKNDHESVSDLINRKTFDNMEHSNIYKDQINQLQNEIINLNEKCKHRKVCLQKLNDILNQKEDELLHLNHSLKNYQLENQALQNQQEELNCQNIQLIEELQNVIRSSQETISQLNQKVRDGEKKCIQLKSAKEQENHTQLNQTTKQVEDFDSIKLKLKKQESQIGLLTEQNQEKYFEIENLNQLVLQYKEQIKQNEFEIKRFKDLCASQEDQLNQQCNQQTSTLLLFTQRENELTSQFNNIQKDLQQQIAQYQKDHVEIKGKMASLIQKELNQNQQIKQLGDSYVDQEKINNVQNETILQQKNLIDTLTIQCQQQNLQFQSQQNEQTIQELQIKLGSSKTTIDELDNKIKEEEFKFLKLKQENDDKIFAQQTQISKQEMELEGLKSLSKKQHSQLEQYSEQNQKLRQDIELLKTEAIALNDQIKLYDAEIKRLTNLQIAQEDQLKAYSNQISSRSDEQGQQQNSKQIEQILIQQKDYSDLQAKLSQIMQKEIVSHQKIKILEDQVTDLEELNKNLVDTNSKQKKQLSNLDQQCQQHEIQFELQYKERQTLEELIAQNKQKLIYLEEKLNQSIFTIQQYEQQIQNQQIQLSILNQTQQELQFYQQQFQALSTNLDESKLQTERVLKQKEDFVVQLENTINTNSQLQTSNKTLEQKYKLIENNHSSLTQENRRLQNQLSDSIIISKQKELENQELQKLNETCNKQINQLQHQYTQLEQSYHQIESDKQAINLQQYENSHLLELSILENESKLTKLQKQNYDLKEEINQLKTNQNEKEHQFAQTVKQYYQKNQEQSTRIGEVNKQVKEKNEEIQKIKLQMDDAQIKSQLFKMKDETYRRLLSRIIKSIDPFCDTKKINDVDDLLETAVQKVQSLVKQKKKNKENDEFSLNSQKEPFNLELSQIVQN